MKKITPPTLMLICLLAMIALNWIVPIAWISSWALLIAGILLIILGLVMAFGAEAQFRHSGTTVDYLGTASRLVTDGWFQYSRNPMYLSFVLMLVGAWLSLVSLSPLLGVLAFVVLTEQWYIFPEEQRLTASFGQAYQAYRKRTRRWLSY
jgi:protein-S-isoprenylcysteine O-methyltransferase Ste14